MTIGNLGEAMNDPTVNSVKKHLLIAAPPNPIGSWSRITAPGSVTTGECHAR